MTTLLLRPYYGINVHGDMHGDLGISDHLPHVYPDLSLVYAATLAHAALGERAHVLDANLERALPREVLGRLRPSYDEIVLKAAAPTIRADLDFAVALKRRYPAARLHLTGYVAKLLAGWIRAHRPEIDCIAQVPMESYVHGLVTGRPGPLPGPVSGPVPGLPIDELPRPDYALFPYQRMVDIDGVLRAGLYMSRGCAVGCDYCPYPDFYGRRFDYRAEEKVLGDLEHLATLGFRSVLFRDQYFAADRRHAENVCKELVRRKLKLRWRCETRLESLPLELIDLMAEAGLEWVNFGVESASPETLQAWSRPALSEDKLHARIERLHRHGVGTLAFYVIGFPQDTWESVRATHALARRLGTTAVKYSIYAPCAPEAIPEPERVPEHFVPFGNLTTVNPCQALSREELLFLVDHLTNTYHVERSHQVTPEVNELQGVWAYHGLHQRRYREAVERLAARAREASIFDL